MALSVFDHKAQAPGPAARAKALGKAAPFWDKLVAAVTEQVGTVTEEWNFAGAKYGWSMRLRLKDRVVLYLIPQAGQVLAGIVLGEHAVEASRSLKLPKAVRAAVDAAPRYAEGRGVRLPVATAADVRAITTLVLLKLAARTGRTTRSSPGR